MIAIKPKKGDLLFAEPTILGDISFNRSVILLTNHSKDGSIGFILNKPLNFLLSDLIPEVEQEFKVYNGGPVEQDNLYFIHKKPELIPDSIEINNEIYWGGNFDVALQLIKDKKLDSNDIKFFLGYSGWGSGQLEGEMERDHWILSDLDSDIIFEKESMKKWPKAYENSFIRL